MNYASAPIPVNSRDQAVDQALRFQFAEAAQGGEVQVRRLDRDRGPQSGSQPALQLCHKARISDVRVYIQYQ